MVAGTTTFDEVRSVKLLFASNDAGSITLLKTTVIVVLSGTLVAFAQGWITPQAAVNQVG